MHFHKPVKELLRSQIDCDVVSADMLVDMAFFQEGKLHVHEETFDCLFVPYSEALPTELLTAPDNFAAQGLPVLFVGGLPVRSSDGGDATAALERLVAQDSVCVLSLNELTNRLRAMGIHEIETEAYSPYLRYYHYEHDDLDVYMFFNEHPHERLETTVQIAAEGDFYRYDAFSNKLSPIHDETIQVVKAGKAFSLKLYPYESTIVLVGDGVSRIPPENRQSIIAEPTDEVMRLNGPWNVEIAASEIYPKFAPWRQLNELTDLSRPELLPSFSGTFSYEGTFDWKHAETGDPICLDLGEVYETAQVWVNGTNAGLKICLAYRLSIGDLVCPGVNAIKIEVTNTLVREQPDPFSRFAPFEPSGLIGPVRLLYTASDS